MEPNMSFGKGVVFSDVLSDIEKAFDLNLDADLLETFPANRFFESFAGQLAAAGQNVIGALSVAHFGSEKAAIRNDNGTCGGSNLLNLAHR